MVYTAGSPFDVDEAEAWWLCFDTLTMIDGELRGVHAILDAHGIQPFLATAVKGAKSPEAVASLITTKGWKPVNTELRVSDVPALVELVGGERLYGSDRSVPVRELIQNAADAIRALRLIRGHASSSGKITVRLRQEGDSQWIEVEDDGVGMSPAVLTEALLDFGKSFWRSAAVRSEFPGLLSKGLKPIGRFGIGFFSVFMLGDHVTVTTRRYDAAALDTHTLDFQKGLRMRPILREPTAQETLAHAGTRVCVRLRIPADEPDGLLYRGGTGKEKVLSALREFVARVCPAVDVSIYTDEHGQHSPCIVADDWLSEQPANILLRTAEQSGDWFESRIKPVTAHLRELRDSLTSQCFGRACICPRESYWSAGVVTVGGLRAAKLQQIAGVLNGEPVTVARNSALPTVPAPVLRNWATEQAQLIAAAKLSGRDKLNAACLVMLLGGDATGLPITTRGGEYLTASALIEVLRVSEEVAVYLGAELEYDDDDPCRPKDFENDLVVSKELLFLPAKTRPLLEVGGHYWPDCVPDLYLPGHSRTCEDAFIRTLELAWGSAPDYDEDARVVGSVHDMEIERTVRIYSNPPVEEIVKELLED